MLEGYKGCLVGSAVGDALGAPHEFKPPTAIEIVHQFEMTGGGIFRWKPGQTTDDTDLSLVVVDSLIENRNHVPQDIADRMLLWFEEGPKDIGGTTRASLTLYAEGVSWRESGRLAIKLNCAGPGNGSLMRTAPIGLYLRGFPEDIDRVAAEISAITHAHEETILACQMASHLVALLASGFSKNDAIDALKTKYPGNTKAGYYFRSALDGVTYYPGNYGHVFDTLSIALHSFVESNTFDEAVIKAIQHGWDTDTQATVAGAFAGSLWGTKEIPNRWKSKLNPVSAKQLEKKAEIIYKLNKNLTAK